MKQEYLLSLFFSFALSVGLLNASSTLQYKANERVAQNHHAVAEMTQEWPQFTLKTRTEQLMDLEVSIIELNKDKTLPTAISIELKRIKLDLKTNDSEKSLDTNRPNSLMTIQASQLLNRSIRIELNKEGKLVDCSQEVLALQKKYPIAKQLLTDTFFLELVQRLFPLVQQELIEGEQYQQSQDIAVLGKTPISYQLNIVNPSTVEASFEGDISFEDSNQKTFQLKGKSEGSSSWNPQQALIVQSNSHSSYEGTRKIDNDDCKVSVVVDYEITSHKI